MRFKAPKIGCQVQRQLQLKPADFKNEEGKVREILVLLRQVPQQLSPYFNCQEAVSFSDLSTFHTDSIPTTYITSLS